MVSNQDWEAQQDRLQQNLPDDVDEGPKARFDEAPDLRTTPNRPIQTQQLA